MTREGPTLAGTNGSMLAAELAADVLGDGGPPWSASLATPTKEVVACAVD